MNAVRRNEGHTPIEVLSVLELHPDYDLAVRCLEYIRLNFGVIIPERARLDVRLLALCHHHPNNIYPALAIVGSEAVYPDLEYEEMERFTERIDAWVKERTLPVVIAEAQSVNAPTWAELKAGYG